MDELKYFLWVIAISGLGLMLYSRKDYVKQAIEGRWRLIKIINADSSEKDIDTVFFNFQQGVFTYSHQKNSTDNELTEYGKYKEKDDKLIITMTNDVNLVCSEEMSAEKEDGYADWIFVVKKRTSSVLELEFNNELLLFRKY